MSPTFFTTEDGDIVLRASPGSGPNHDFPVHRLILSLASPVFKDMFSFAQPSDQSEQLGVPVVDLPDSPEVLDVILRFIYPGVEPPKFTDLTTLSALLSAADKYNIASMWPVLREALKTFIPNESFRAYIVACRFGFLEEARAAAKASTPSSIPLQRSHEKEVRDISNVDLYRLVWFVNKREASGRSRIRYFASFQTCYHNPCPIEEHWEDAVNFYEKLERRLLGAFAEDPCVQYNGLSGVLDEQPDPPPGCKPEDLGSESVCFLRPSYIRDNLARLARELGEINDGLLREAFGKEF